MGKPDDDPLAGRIDRIQADGFLRFVGAAGGAGAKGGVPLYFVKSEAPGEPVAARAFDTLEDAVEFAERCLTYYPGTWIEYRGAVLVGADEVQRMSKARRLASDI